MSEDRAFVALHLAAASDQEITAFRAGEASRKRGEPGTVEAADAHYADTILRVAWRTGWGTEDRARGGRGLAGGGLVALLLALFLLLFPSIAFAQGGGAAAQELFEQGKAALAAGDLPTACTRFRASDQIDPASGTKANLANCEEKRGRIATAWETFKEALRGLPADDPRRAKIQDRIDALGPRLPRLELLLAPGAPAELTVSEGTAVLGSAATWGIALPFDPGPHKLTVSAPGRAPWVLEVVLVEGETKHVVVGAEPPKPVSAGPVAGSPQPLPGAGGASIGPWVVGGVGVAFLAVSGVVGGLLLHEKSVNSGGCNPVTRTCTQAGKDAASSGAVLGPLTTATLVTGLAGVAAGGIWLGLRGPARQGTGVGVGPVLGGAALRVEGSWW